MSDRTIYILEPTALPLRREEPIPRLANGLAGKVVGILNNRWKSMDLLARRFERILPTHHGVTGVIIRTIPVSEAAPPGLFDEMAQKVGLTVVGLAN
jgi:hypothetical protein